ncbi:hypothetical protein PQQ73_29285 [Paraburkholderia strydomiana]|uniref:Uncharacterized protein n=1 Tax=Paraburkholderia strydomiana TaxID=1245417 RepID=A0ABW9ENU9_9BURK
MELSDTATMFASRLIMKDGTETHSSSNNFMFKRFPWFGTQCNSEIHPMMAYATNAPARAIELRFFRA